MFSLSIGTIALKKVHTKVGDLTQREGRHYSNIEQHIFIIYIIFLYTMVVLIF